MTHAHIIHIHAYTCIPKKSESQFPHSLCNVNIGDI